MNPSIINVNTTGTQIKKRLSWLAFALIASLSVNTVSAQSESDVYGGSADITWLGMDFTQVKFIGSATQFKDAGEISNSEFRDKYIPAWNQLFLDEPKKYDVAKAVRRTEVKNSIDVTDNVNSKIKKEFFSNSTDEYASLNESKVADLVKSYDFKGKSGIGLMFFIDGMSKGKKEVSAWVTYVNMKTKKVLTTFHTSAKAGGFGFRNYWAGGFKNVLEDVEKDYKKKK